MGESGNPAKQDRAGERNRSIPDDPVQVPRPKLHAFATSVAVGVLPEGSPDGQACLVLIAESGDLEVTLRIPGPMAPQIHGALTQAIKGLADLALGKSGLVTAKPGDEKRLAQEMGALTKRPAQTG